MGPKETNFFYTILIAGIVFLLVFLSFMVTALRYRKKGFASYLKKTGTDFKMVELEKRRIATDVHDGIGSDLSAVKLLVDELLSSETADPVLKSQLVTTLQQMAASVREVSNDMIPYALQREGLITAITELTKRLFPYPMVRVTTQFTPDAGDHLEESAGVQIYRIVQELLNNIVKHAEASAVYISLAEKETRLTLTICDNGIGFDQHIVKKTPGGIGLMSISNRVILLKGDMFLTTSPGKGTEYVIELPLRNNMLGRRV